jgi:hypothetical protein
MTEGWLPIKLLLFALWFATAAAVGAVDATDSLFVGSTLLLELLPLRTPTDVVALLFFPIPAKGGNETAGARASWACPLGKEAAGGSNTFTLCDMPDRAMFEGILATDLLVPAAAASFGATLSPVGVPDVSVTFCFFELLSSSSDEESPVNMCFPTTQLSDATLSLDSGKGSRRDGA